MRSYVRRAAATAEKERDPVRIYSHNNFRKFLAGVISVGLHDRHRGPSTFPRVRADILYRERYKVAA